LSVRYENDDLDAPPFELVSAWQFVRRNAMRIVLGTGLAAAICFGIVVEAKYQREQSMRSEIKALGGGVKLGYCGPNWIPLSLRINRYGQLNLQRYWARIESVSVCDKQVTSDTIRRPGALTSLQVLDLRGTAVSDADLEHLSHLPKLQVIRLRHTRISDAGLRHLQMIKTLEQVHVRDTEVTANGRTELCKALPNCRVYPEE
jgi:hypothetical protein